MNDEAACEAVYRAFAEPYEQGGAGFPSEIYEASYLEWFQHNLGGAGL